MNKFKGTKWLHIKSGNYYWVLGDCRIEATNTPAIRYVRDTGPDDEWVRPKSEFFDGRFVSVSSSINSKSGSVS